MVFPSRKPRAFITGINGFTGHYMSEELVNAGYDVYGTVSSNKQSSERIFAVDINHKAILWDVLEQVQPDVVVHLAAIAFVGHNNVDEIYATNIVGTRNLLEGLARLVYQPKAVLLTSSANLYGNANVEVISETTALAPVNDYAVSKLAMEYMAHTWQDKLPITIVRPFNYSGVGQADNYLLPKIVSHFAQKKDRLELGNIHVERDWSDVRDVVLKYRLLLETKEIAGQTFNVCSSVPYTLAHLVSMMENISNHHLNVVVNPAFVRSNEVVKLLGDESKLRKTLSTTIVRPLNETLSWMYHALSL
jgi:nucleoside-diphosphate-sugar epimerase